MKHQQFHKKTIDYLKLFQPASADLAIGDITITAQRNEDIDFTLPFMKLGNKFIFGII